MIGKEEKKTKLNNYTLHQNETESINRLKRSLNARPIYQITSISTVQQIEQASNVTKSIRTTEKAWTKGYCKSYILREIS